MKVAAVVFSGEKILFVKGRIVRDFWPTFESLTPPDCNYDVEFVQQILCNKKREGPRY
jgi:hypothetical protein